MFPILNAGALTVLIGLILRNRLANRRLTIEENAGLRKEFIEEMAALRHEVKDLRGEVRARDDKIDALRIETAKRDEKIDLLRAEITELHGIIDGMRRENQASHISGQRVIADAIRSLPQASGGSQ
jgi:predicted nuclease with TOPRIM domain